MRPFLSNNTFHQNDNDCWEGVSTGLLVSSTVPFDPLNMWDTVTPRPSNEFLVSYTPILNISNQNDNDCWEWVSTNISGLRHSVLAMQRMWCIQYGSSPDSIAVSVFRVILVETFRQSRAGMSKWLVPLICRHSNDIMISDCGMRIYSYMILFYTFLLILASNLKTLCTDVFLGRCWFMRSLLIRG